ncbi:MAG TPA: UbiA family prenyltransferase [Candidatus Polarisedimenticolia bacterium]|nr:UbiA family prenyltransferase [Candidatus Polarisedimenticolia bacterium]
MSGAAAAAGRVRTYVEFTRPFTLLPPTLGVVSGAVTAFGSAYNPDPARRLTWDVALTVLLGSLCAALLNAASNGINQYYDLEIDRRNKPGRHLVTGAISLQGGFAFSMILYAAAILPTWLVVIHPYEGLWAKLTAPPGRHECTLIYLIGMLFTFIYSAPAFGRTKRLGIWANVTIAIPRGCLLKVAGWSMVASVAHLEPWFIGGIFMLFLLGASTTKDFSDMEGDRAGGCRTLPIVYGVRRSAWMIAPFFVAPWLLLPLGAALENPFDPGRRVLTGNPWMLSSLGILLAAWGLYVCWLILKRPEELAEVENHVSWKHMYLMMMAAQAGFAAAYLV